jgi:hypothetical protein
MGKKAGGGGRPGQSSPSQFGTSPWAQQGQGGPGDRQQGMQQAMQQFQDARQNQGGGIGQMGGRPNGGFDPSQFQAQAQQHAQEMRTRIDQQASSMQGQNPGLAMQQQGADKGGTPNSSSQANLQRASAMANQLSAQQGGGGQPGTGMTQQIQSGYRGPSQGPQGTGGGQAGPGGSPAQGRPGMGQGMIR